MFVLEPLEVIGKGLLQKDTKKFLHQSKSTKGKILTAAIGVDEDYVSYMSGTLRNKI